MSWRSEYAAGSLTVAVQNCLSHNRTLDPGPVSAFHLICAIFNWHENCHVI